ncbi:MAG TPA: hypothetical protein DEW46_14810, partial [Verrucomicrobia bacterium]|nr:hypothetical protein [Verrucomicrobiota bacterium]
MIAELAGEEKCFRDLLLRPEKGSAEDERRGRSRKAEVRFGCERARSEKVNDETSSGSEVAIGLGIERTWDGIRTGETGYRNRIIAVQTQLGSEVWAGKAPTRTGID